MEKKVIVEFFKKIGYFLLIYVKSNYKEKIMSAFFSAKEHFVETLWESVKGDITTNVEDVCKRIEEFLTSASLKEKEEAALEVLFKKVKLPLFLKPFKALIKKALRNKIEALIKEALNKLHQII